MRQGRRPTGTWKHADAPLCSENQIQICKKKYNITIYVNKNGLGK